jgi:hypothetical protein
MIMYPQSILDALSAPYLVENVISMDKDSGRVTRIACRNWKKSNVTAPAAVEPTVKMPFITFAR